MHATYTLLLLGPSNANQLCTNQSTSTPLNVGKNNMTVAKKSLVFGEEIPHASLIPNNDMEPQVQIPNDEKLPNKVTLNDAILPPETIKSLVRAVETGYISSIAYGIQAHCPEIVSELVDRFIKSKEETFHSLCKRNGNGSVLYNKNYNDMANFEMATIWLELVTHHPFLVDVFNVVAGKMCSATDTPKESRIKYSLIYSILMNHRWHELSLLQRVNSVLMIEGGGTARVCLNIHIFYTRFFL